MMTPGPGPVDADAVQLDVPSTPGPGTPTPQAAAQAEAQQQQRRNLTNTLMVILHAAHCVVPQCQPQCHNYRSLLAHIKTCVARPCTQVQGCQQTRNIVYHFRNCNLPTCVCPTVRQRWAEEAQRRRQEIVCGLPCEAFECSLGPL
jgi:hypothetical protein